MNKKVIGLVVAVVVVAVLGVSLFLLMEMPSPEVQEKEPESDTMVVKLIDKTSAELMKVTVNNEGGTYTLNNIGDNKFEIDELKGLPVKEGMLDFLASEASSVTASQVVEESPTDLAKYGLDKPRDTITSEFSDNTKVTLKIGNDAPASSGVYAQKDGEAAVYLLGSVAVTRFDMEKTEYIRTDVTPVFDQEAGDQLKFESFELSGTSREDVLKITLEPTDENSPVNFSTYNMEIGEKKKSADTGKIEEILKSTLNIVSNDIVAYNVTPEIVKEYKLDQPYSKAILKAGEDISFVLSASEPVDNSVYVMTDKAPIIYKIPAERSWINAQWNDLISKLIVVPYIETVKTITITAKDKAYVFESNGTDETFKVSCNGKELTVDNYKKFYQVIVGATNDEVTEIIPEEEPILTYEYKYHESDKVDTVNFYVGPTRKVFVRLNDEEAYLTKESYVDKVYEDLEKISQDMPVSTTF